MDNHILGVTVRDRSLTPAAAELRVVVQTAFCTPRTEIRGRLMGPHCPFASTVEVAYALRPLPEADELSARVVIPEPSFWDPQSPFLYGGPVELWEDGGRCEVVQVRHGLRVLRFGPRGLTVNGRPLALRAKELTTACPDDEALRLRRSGYNLLIAPVAEETAALWDTGDRLGFLVAGRVNADDAETPARLAELRRHPSCLGWLAGDAASAPEGSLPAGALGFFGPID
jgi:hypothetical protein